MSGLREHGHRAWSQSGHGEQRICGQFEDGRSIPKLLEMILFELGQKDNGRKVRWRAVALGRSGTSTSKGPLDYPAGRTVKLEVY